MSYDYIIWKRSPKAKTAMLADVYRSICDGKDHPAMAPFDTEALESEIKKKFGDLNNDPDGPFLYGFDRGEIAPWLSISMGHSQVEALTDTIIELASTQGLMVYDPQRLTVWGNRRTQE